MIKRKSWQDYQKEIADDHYYYARSCIRQNFFPGSEKLFIDMVKACFVQRRKTISNNLRQWLQDKELAAKILEKAGIDPAARAQNLDLETFIRLYEENYEDIRKCKGESRP